MVTFVWEVTKSNLVKREFIVSSLSDLIHFSTIKQIAMIFQAALFPKLVVFVNLAFLVQPALKLMQSKFYVRPVHSVLMTMVLKQTVYHALKITTVLKKSPIKINFLVQRDTCVQKVLVTTMSTLVHKEPTPTKMSQKQLILVNRVQLQSTVLTELQKHQLILTIVKKVTILVVVMMINGLLKMIMLFVNLDLNARLSLKNHKSVTLVKSV